MSTLPFTKSRRGWLVILIIACQALCFGGALYATLGWLHGRLAIVLEQHLAGLEHASYAERSATGEAFAARVERELRPIRRYGLILTSVLTVAGAVLSVVVVRCFEMRMLQANQDLERIIDRRARDLLRTRDAVILGLAKFAEFRDVATGQHLERIGRYAEIIAGGLRREESQRYPMITEEWIHDLSVGSALHDIGKVGIPDHILLKPGKLTDEERALIEEHPVMGGECLSAMASELGDCRLLSLACEIAYSHHEWWDGTGYPFRLAAEAIPLAARIVALADVYDALTTSRPYKRALTHERAKETILAGMGTQFDPFIVGAFLLNEAEFSKTSRELTRSDLERCDDVDPGLDLAALELVGPGDV